MIGFRIKVLETGDEAIFTTIVSVRALEILMMVGSLTEYNSLKLVAQGTSSILRSGTIIL